MWGDDMPDYKKLYFRLFGAVADAVEHLELGSIKLAKDGLIRAQQDAEEEYLKDGDEE